MIAWIASFLPVGSDAPQAGWGQPITSQPADRPLGYRSGVVAVVGKILVARQVLFAVLLSVFVGQILFGVLFAVGGRQFLLAVVRQILLAILFAVGIGSAKVMAEQQDFARHRNAGEARGCRHMHRFRGQLNSTGFAAIPAASPRWPLRAVPESAI
jgi:hypothetical protein